MVAPGDPDWDDARRAWNLAADQRPALVVRAGAPGDLAATVRHAAAHGLRVAPQGTGHGAMSLGDLSGTILLRTGALAGVTVDPGARTARVEAGARWRDVAAAAGEHGLVGLHGDVGRRRRRGLHARRRHRLARAPVRPRVHHVRSFAVVTADGEERQVDAEHEPDLFWALRGGGGGPVVVRSLELDLFPLRTAFGGALMWPLEQAAEVVHAWREWVAGLPDHVTPTLKLLRFPPVPQVPEPLRGRALVSAAFVTTGDAAEGEALAAPLRAVAPPYLDLLREVPAPALGDLSGDPVDPSPGLGGSVMLDAFTAEAADAYLALAGPGADVPLVALEVRHLGGALREPVADPGAAGAVLGGAVVYGIGVPMGRGVRRGDLGDARGGRRAARAVRRRARHAAHLRGDRPRDPQRVPARDGRPARPRRRRPRPGGPPGRQSRGGLRTRDDRGARSAEPVARRVVRREQVGARDDHVGQRLEVVVAVDRDPERHRLEERDVGHGVAVGHRLVEGEARARGRGRSRRRGTARRTTRATS